MVPLRNRPVAPFPYGSRELPKTRVLKPEIGVDTERDEVDLDLPTRARDDAFHPPVSSEGLDGVVENDLHPQAR